jgi:hypothetical protein
MTSLPPPKVKIFAENSKERLVYNIVEKYAENIPVPNDRNRMGFCLFKYVTGEGDKPEILVKTTKIRLIGISPKEMAAKLNEELIKAELIQK